MPENCFTVSRAFLKLQFYFFLFHFVKSIKVKQSDFGIFNSFFPGMINTIEQNKSISLDSSSTMSFDIFVSVSFEPGTNCELIVN